MMPFYIILAMLLSYIVTMGFYSIVGQHQRNENCYQGYIQECNDCHDQNGSWLYCSGFCIESDNISNGCEYDLDKSCDSVPRKCVI